MHLPDGPYWGPQEAIEIAKNHPELAVTSAENYEWYADVSQPPLYPSLEPLVNRYRAYSTHDHWLARGHHVLIR